MDESQKHDIGQKKPDTKEEPLINVKFESRQEKLSGRDSVWPPSRDGGRLPACKGHVRGLLWRWKCAYRDCVVVTRV